MQSKNFCGFGWMLVALALSFATLSGCRCDSDPAEPGPGQVTLDGQLFDVDWSDGDSFSWKVPGEKKKRGSRLMGFNTLEDYGPVHRWGSWTAEELYDIAKEAGRFAASRGWNCRKTGRSGGYGREGIRCPDLPREMIKRGLAHAYSMDGPSDPALLDLQKKAQAEGQGMWKNGIPEAIVTSLHSLDEKSGKKSTYDRVVDVATGHATPVTHTETYKPCQGVCRRGSCMQYIPYPQRYGKDRLRCDKQSGG